MKKSYYYGIYAELLIILLLFCSFYKIISRRYKSPFGEIDIIAFKKNTVIFIEVKARRKFEHFELLKNKQNDRIRKSSLFFLSKNYKKYNNCDVRFDLVFVFGLFQIKYIKNV